MRLAVEEVCEAFRLGSALAPAERVQGGFLHAVWRLRTEHADCAVKVLRPPAGADRPEWFEHYRRSFELERAAIAGGISAPSPLATAGGDWLARAGGATVRAHDWVGGRSLRPDDVTPQLARAAGALLARIHLLRAQPGSAGLDDLFPVPLEGWRDREAELPELAGAGEVMTELGQALQEGMALVCRPVLGHRDLNPKNLVATGEGSLSVIDWELSGPVEPRLEAAACALDWAGAFWWEPDPAIIAAVLSGYADAGGQFPTPDDHRIFAGWLAGLAGFAHTSYLRALHGRTATECRRARRNAAVAVSLMRRGLGARQRWLRLLHC